MKLYFEYKLKDVEDIALKIIESSQDRKVWTFTGDLGAGKTTLIQAIVHHLGSEDSVSSPTYTLVNEYTSPKYTIYHIDAYRLKDESEAFDIGLEEIIDSGEYVFIEWPQKVSPFLPDHYIDINIEIYPDKRYLEMEVI